MIIHVPGRVLRQPEGRGEEDREPVVDAEPRNNNNNNNNHNNNNNDIK